MKKIFINYYSFIIAILYFAYNQLIVHLVIGGLLYNIFVFIIIILNSIILIIFRKEIKFKTFSVILFFILSFFSKNYMQYIYGLTFMIVLIAINFMNSFIIQILTVLITFFYTCFFIPLLIIALLFSSATSKNNQIRFVENHETIVTYEEDHYYYKNNYEAFSFGDISHLNYRIGKYYEFLNIDDIIYIYYRKPHEVTKEEYYNFIKNNAERLVGETNGYK